MSLNFPNASRSYDATGHRVRFWGYDNAIEVPFFLEENAIFKLFPMTVKTETQILAAFDTLRDRVIEAAGRIYAPRKGRHFYVLAAADFN
jgi:Protein of unknown function (DUF1488)